MRRIVPKEYYNEKDDHTHDQVDARRAHDTTPTARKGRNEDAMMSRAASRYRHDDVDKVKGKRKKKTLKGTERGGEGQRCSLAREESRDKVIEGMVNEPIQSTTRKGEGCKQ